VSSEARFCCYSKCNLKASSVWYSVLGLNVTTVFSLFMHCPEYCRRTSHMTFASSTIALPKITLLSAKRRCCILDASRHTETP
ncbi:hypothetical protein Droror1_Dr00024527, partial [Drosera rotundifolia]